MNFVSQGYRIIPASEIQGICCFLPKNKKDRTSCEVRSWWRLLDSNQWPHACEDSIGMPSAEFWENKAGLPRDFLTRRCAPFRCFRPGFSARGA